MLRSNRLIAAVALSVALAACAGTDSDPEDDVADAESSAEEETSEEEMSDDDMSEEEPEEEDAAEEPAELVAVEFAPPSGVTIASAAPYSSVPLALGFFEDEGLDVTINDAVSGSVAAIQAVGAGQVDIGMGSTSSLIAAVANGADVSGFYTQITGNNQLPAVGEDSPIETVLDLEGTTIGVRSLQSSSVGLISAMVLQEGGDPDSISFVAAGSGLEALNFYEAGQIDAFGMWDAVYAEIDALGLPLRLVGNDYFSDLGFHMSLVATDEDLADPERQAVFAGFARALSKGMLFAQENPEAAVQLHWETYPDSKPVGVSDEDALAQAVRVLTARNAFTAQIDGLWGNASTDQVQQQLDLQAELNDMTGLEVSDVWTDVIIGPANEFDADAVVAEAADA